MLWCIPTPTMLRLLFLLDKVLGFWILTKGLAERSYPTSNVVGGETAIRLESFCADARGDEEAGGCEEEVGGCEDRDRYSRRIANRRGRNRRFHGRRSISVS